MDGLVARVLAELDQPTAIVAQSMGGVIAMLAALRRPAHVTHLVLTATSGGVDVDGLGAQDWRPAYIEANPALPRWFTEMRLDLSRELPSITAPVLLLWGDADPISPVAVGRRLAALLPDAALHVLAGGQHDLAHARAREVAPLIEAHLQTVRHRGACLCQGVRFSITGPLSPIEVCHCAQCRQAQGGPVATNIPVSTSAITFHSGEDLLQRHASSPGKVRAFCKVCGSPVFSQRDALPGVLRIRAGLLEGPVDAPLDFHAFTASKARWWPICDALPQHEGWAKQPTPPAK
jgi:hypothetical protein